MCVGCEREAEAAASLLFLLFVFIHSCLRCMAPGRIRKIPFYTLPPFSLSLCVCLVFIYSCRLVDLLVLDVVDVQVTTLGVSLPCISCRCFINSYVHSAELYQAPESGWDRRLHQRSTSFSRFSFICWFGKRVAGNTNGLSLEKSSSTAALQQLVGRLARSLSHWLVFGFRLKWFAGGLTVCLSVGLAN